MNKTVYLSAWRTNIRTAQAIYHFLADNGYDVFAPDFEFYGHYFTMDNRVPSKWFDVLNAQIKSRSHFLTLVTPSGTHNIDRRSIQTRELELAIESKRNIVPISFNGFAFQTPVLQFATLPEVNADNYFTLNPESFEDSIKQLVNTRLDNEVSVQPLDDKLLAYSKTIYSLSELPYVYNYADIQAESHFEHGFLMQIKKDYRTAYEYLTKAIELNSEYREAYNARASVSRKVDVKKQKQDDFRKVVRLIVKNEYAVKHIEQAYRHLHEFETASADREIKIALEKNPQLDEVFAQRAKYFIEAEEPYQAMSECRTALMLNSKNGLAYLYQAQANMQLENFRDAVSDFSLAMLGATEEIKGIAFQGRGGANFMREQFQAAVDDFEAALQYVSDSEVDEVQLMLEKAKHKLKSE